MPENTLFTCSTEEDGATLYDPVHPLWNGEHKINIDRLSTGNSAFEEKGYGWTNLTQVSSLWNEYAIFFYFECWHSWKLASKPKAETNQADVSEVEVARLLLRPEGCEDYFKVSIDSHGCQSAEHVFQSSVDVDPTWDPAADARIFISDTEKIWRAFLRLPYEPMIAASGLDSSPEVGDAWRLNLHRAAGRMEERELLSWRPSYLTLSDSFVFGHLIFLGAA